MNYEKELPWMRTVTPATQLIAQQALAKIDRDYSATGDPANDASAELYLPYHNGRHTRRALRDIPMLSQIVGLTQAEQDVAVAAMACHDVEYDLGATPGDNEAASAEWLADHMEASGEFTSQQIACGRLAVHGTAYCAEDGLLIQQKANQQSYPNARAALVAKVVASSDLGCLWTPDGPYRSHKFLQERETGASGRAPSKAAIVDFQTEQMGIFRGGYRYPNAEIAHALSRKKDSVQGYSALLLDKLNLCQINSWDEILASDQAFMARHEVALD